MTDNNEKAPEAGKASAATPKTPSVQKKRSKAPLTVAVVAVIVLVAGAGFWAWHEQPSFCNAICHTPMDAYNLTYDQEPGTAGVDKWGNAVANTSGMLAVTHKAEAETTCMGCHVPQLSEQISEGLGWVSGNYEVVATSNDLFVPQERSLSHLTAARGIASEAFCLNEACHTLDDGTPMTRADLVELTSGYERNPHEERHEAVACDECHKAHRESVNQCSQCHADAPIPDGWITVSDEKERMNGALVAAEK